MERLALLGGRPAVPGGLGSDRLVEHERLARMARRACARLTSREWAGAQVGGGVVRRLEDALCELLSARHVLATSSGTTALEIALRAAGVGDGDEVACSSYDWGAAAGCVLRLGAIPVTVDIEPETYTMDPGDLERHLSPRTRAVVVTHLFGQPADMPRIIAVARRRRCAVIEDACQALGAGLRSRRAGALGDLAAFSFGWGKLAGAGEGGAVVTGARGLFERAVDASQHPVAQLARTGRVGPLGPLGMNGRIHPVAAAMAMEALRDVERRLGAREDVVQLLAGRMRGLPGIRPPVVRADAQHAWHRFCPTLQPGELHGVTRATLMAALEAEGVPVNVGCIEVPLHRLAPLRHRAHPLGVRAATPMAEERCDAVGLGVGGAPEAMSARQAEAIGRAIEKVLSRLDVLARHQERCCCRHPRWQSRHP